MGAVGIVLVGGRSSRMGAPKAELEWHGSTLLRRTIGIVERGAGGPVIVVRAPGQPLTHLPDDVQLIDDDQEGLGPLQGLAMGLTAAAARGDPAFVCSTDLPFLHPAYVARVLAAVHPDTDVALPIARGHRQPLAAAYRTHLAAEVRRLLDAGARKPALLFEVARTRRLDEDDLLADATLARADPELASVHNINDPEEYAAARAVPAPMVSVRRFGARSPSGHAGARSIRAATVAGAADAIDVALDRHLIAAVNGERITRDGDTPLVAGDEVTFMAADAGG